MMEKMTAGDSKAKERNLDTHATYVINSCQGRLLEFYLKKNYWIHQHAQVLVVFVDR